MKLVVDASVAIKWMIDEQDSDLADRLLDGGHDFLAPELIIAEVISAAWKQRRLGSIGDAQYDEIVIRIADGPIVYRPLRPLGSRARQRWRARSTIRSTTASTWRSPRPRTCRSSPPTGGWWRRLAARRSRRACSRCNELEPGALSRVRRPPHAAGGRSPGAGGARGAGAGRGPRLRARQLDRAALRALAAGGGGRASTARPRCWPRRARAGCRPAGSRPTSPAGRRTAPFDLLYSNAALQWLPDHAPAAAAAARRAARGRGAGGADAAQLRGRPPMCCCGRWRTAGPGPRASRRGCCGRRSRRPSGTTTCCQPLAAALDIWESEYLQVLEGDDPVLSWTRSTALRPVIAALGPDEQARFEADYAERLRRGLPPAGGRPHAVPVPPPVHRGDPRALTDRPAPSAAGIGGDAHLDDPIRIGRRLARGDLVDHVHALDHLAPHGVLAVEMRGRRRS